VPVGDERGLVGKAVERPLMRRAVHTHVGHVGLPGRQLRR
jgi:hypothetical protein